MNAIPLNLHRSTDEPSHHPLDIMGNAITDSLAIVRLLHFAAGDSQKREQKELYLCLGVVIDLLTRGEKAADELLQHYRIEKCAEDPKP